MQLRRSALGPHFAFLAALLSVSCDGRAANGGTAGTGAGGRPALVATSAQGGAAGSKQPGASAAPADEAAMFAAGGYVNREGRWQGSCDKGDPDGWFDATLSFIRDLDGDGLPEAIVTEESSYCYGNTGYAFRMLRKTAAGWTPIAGETGMPVLYKRAGIALPDIEIGGPGANCFRFLRWNGTRYVEGGTSLEGKICKLDPAFAKSAPAPASPPAGALPVKDGLWADNGKGGCARMATNDPAFIVTQNIMTMVQDTQKLKPVKPLGNGRYQTGRAADFDLQVIRVLSPTSMVIESGSADNRGFTWCSPQTRWKGWEE